MGFFLDRQWLWADLTEVHQILRGIDSGVYEICRDWIYKDQMQAEKVV